MFHVSCVMCHLSHVTCHTSCVPCNYCYYFFYTRHVTADTWHVTSDMWHVKCDKWHMTRDKWHMTHDKWHVTHDNVTRDMWRKTHARFGEVDLKLPLFATIFWLWLWPCGIFHFFLNIISEILAWSHLFKCGSTIQKYIRLCLNIFDYKGNHFCLLVLKSTYQSSKWNRFGCQIFN